MEYITTTNQGYKALKMLPFLPFLQFRHMSKMLRFKYLTTMISMGATEKGLATMFGIGRPTVERELSRAGVRVPRVGPINANIRRNMWETWCDQTKEGTAHYLNAVDLGDEVEDQKPETVTSHTVTTAIVSPIVGVTSGTISVKGKPTDILAAVAQVLPDDELVVFVRYNREVNT